MSLRDIYFRFDGRINRKTYWFANIPLAITAFGLVAILSNYSTGQYFASEIWQRPADKVADWLPIWFAYYVFLAIPSSAISVKRLHDRGLPAWIWFAYYAATAVIALLPASTGAGGVSQIVLITYLILGFYFFMELGVLRGSVGANQYGPDTIRADYIGGDQTIWSWLLAPEGRISRQKWWLGVAISLGTLVIAIVIMSTVIGAIASKYPEFEQNFRNPAWLNSPQARPIIMEMTIASAIPSVLIMFTIWSLIALGIKRLHDRGLSSWLILVVVVPFFGLGLTPVVAQGGASGLNFPALALLVYLASAIWAVLQFGILKGEAGANQHGPDPLSMRP